MTLFRFVADHIFSASVSPCYGGGMNKPAPSDRRLKADIELLDVLDNGLRLHTFRYQGGTTEFTGVLAQEVLEHDEFRDAVTKAADGYYRVDYAALGLGHLVTAEMRREGRNATRRLH